MRIIMFICLVLLSSCSGHDIKPVIVWKSYHSYSGKNMPTGICRFGYKSMSNGSMHEFEDSCSKYEIGQIVDFPIDK